jgi:hypothetical protein
LEKYEKPTIKDLGSVEELTLSSNKIGFKTDAFSPALVGSTVAPRP